MLGQDREVHAGESGVGMEGPWGLSKAALQKDCAKADIQEQLPGPFSEGCLAELPGEL